MGLDRAAFLEDFARTAFCAHPSLVNAPFSEDSSIIRGIL
jgi:hypothetical protein